MIRNLLAALTLTGLASCTMQPAFAAKTCYSLVDLGNALRAHGFPVLVFSGEGLKLLVDELEARDGVELGNVTRGFIYNPDGTVYAGLEVDGCMLDRIPLVTPDIRESGKNWNTGRTHS